MAEKIYESAGRVTGAVMVSGVAIFTVTASIPLFAALATLF